MRFSDKGLPKSKNESEVSFNHRQMVSFTTIKNEEKRIQEEHIHKRLWGLLNPGDSEYIERDILNEFLKLAFDPYTPVIKIVPITKDLIGNLSHTLIDF